MARSVSGFATMYCRACVANPMHVPFSKEEMLRAIYHVFFHDCRLTAECVFYRICTLSRSVIKIMPNRGSLETISYVPNSFSFVQYECMHNKHVC